ncbi:delta-6 fatty acid desaturase, partial [Streptomyces varsoviensis]
SQIAASRRANRVLGLVHGNLLLGMSVGWWNDKHNRHHANPNHVDKDPDVGVGALVWTQRQAAERAGFARWLTRNQAWLFIPMLLLEGIALKVSSIQDLRRQRPGERAVEGALLALHYAGYCALLLSCMTPGMAAAFALTHHAFFGLHLGLAFAPNHKGMEMPDPDGERWGHLRRQVLTSRNVRGALLTDWFLGGLNYQIEHHLSLIHI